VDVSFGHVDDRRESLRLVEARALTAPLGHEVAFEEKDFTPRVGLYLTDPRVVDDHAIEGGDRRVPPCHWPLGRCIHVASRLANRALVPWRGQHGTTSARRTLRPIEG
jgi:hypothetical protein